MILGEICIFHFHPTFSRVWMLKTRHTCRMSQRCHSYARHRQLLKPVIYCKADTQYVLQSAVATYGHFFYHHWLQLPSNFLYLYTILYIDVYSYMISYLCGQVVHFTSVLSPCQIKVNSIKQDNSSASNGKQFQSNNI